MQLQYDSTSSTTQYAISLLVGSTTNVNNVSYGYECQTVHQSQ